MRAKPLPLSFHFVQTDNSKCIISHSQIILKLNFFVHPFPLSLSLFLSLSVSNTHILALIAVSVTWTPLSVLSGDWWVSGCKGSGLQCRESQRYTWWWAGEYSSALHRPLWGTVVISGEEVKEGGSVQRELTKSSGNESQSSPVPLMVVQANSFWFLWHGSMFVMWMLKNAPHFGNLNIDLWVHTNWACSVYVRKRKENPYSIWSVCVICAN